MKVLTIFIAILFITSCKISDYEQAFTNNVDTLLNNKLNNYVSSDEYQKELNRIEHEISNKLDSLRSTNPSISPKDYIYIVAGSFKVPENAVNYASDLMSIGIPVKIINYKTFKLVTIASYSNIDSAKRAVYQYRNIVDPDVWIFVRK